MSIALGIRALLVPVADFWPHQRRQNYCPTSTDGGWSAPHTMGTVCCHRCGKLNPSYPHMHWADARV